MAREKSPWPVINAQTAYNQAEQSYTDDPSPTTARAAAEAASLLAVALERDGETHSATHLAAMRGYHAYCQIAGIDPDNL